jgi:2,4-dienoyl-CoA reductase (NADPH2)
VKLFEPIRIGGMELRNRLVMSPMTTGYAGEDQLPSPKLVEFLATRARGGVALMTLEACVVDARHREVPHSMHFASDDVIAPHRLLVDAVHRYGAKIQPQLVHAGPDALSPQIEGIPSLGPSVIPSYLTGTASRALDADELPAIAAQYATAVRRIREAGYDGVELHAAHGYMLLGSFLSPWRNKRGDEYGARTRDGRLRFLLEVLAAIRREVGRDFPLTLRISGYERVPGGRTIDDTAGIAPTLEAAGVDAFHVSGGVIDRLTTMIITGALWGDAHNLAGARAVRNVAGVPVIAVGRIHTAEAAEAILQRGDADLIAMGRPLLADPELPAKARRERRARGERVRLCISCENCVDSMERSTMNCAVNALCGREGEIDLAPAATARDVVVVGGGPGGLESARLAALRGHRVTLFERERFLGGAMLLAATVHPENQPFLDFLLGEVSRLPILVQTGREVTADAVAGMRPDAVIVATGGRLELPRIAGDEQSHVVSGPWLRHLLSGALTAAERRKLAPWQRATLAPAARYLARFATPGRLRAITRAWMPLGRRVVILGADLAAVELAEFLASRRRVVTLVESGDRLAPEVGAKRRAEHMDRLDRLGVAVHTGLSCERITAASVLVRPDPGAPREIAADTVVIAGEVGADTRLFEAIRAAVPNTHAVGDCTGLGLFRKATEDATRAVAMLA